MSSLLLSAIKRKKKNRLNYERVVGVKSIKKNKIFII